jgi:hypothetical protein
MTEISFCTAVKDRLYHLKETLPENLSVASVFPIEMEFVVANYNSADDLSLWIKKYPKVKYVEKKDVLFWDVGEAKHLAHKSAIGKILVNLDADNFLTTEYISWVLKSVSDGFFSVGNNKPTCGGRVAITKNDYEEVGGYRSGFIYTGEHQDLELRLQKLKKEVVFTPVSFLSGIEHSDKERYANLMGNIQNKEQLKEVMRRQNVFNC